MAAACQREASAQQLATDPFGPIKCFQTSTDAGLTEEDAINLCGGAFNAAPGQCYATAKEEFQELSSQKIQQLCNGSTSMQAVACYAHLSEERNDLSEDQMLQYCGTQCPIGPPPPQISSSACVTAALGEGNLTIQQTGALCAGARSAGPAECFMEGLGLHTLSSQQLITLCGDALHCQYPNMSVTPQGKPAGTGFGY